MHDPEALQQTIRECLTRHSNNEIISAFLFGSWAEGRQHRESDVDVGILLTYDLDKRQRFDRRVMLTTELIGALHINEIDVVILNDAPPLFARRIVVEGKPIYCADPEADHAYRRDIQLRAADLAPFIEKHRRALLAGARR